MMAVRSSRANYGLIVFILCAAMMATSCGGGTGSEFLGNSESIRNPSDTIEIARNGDQFLIIKGQNKIGAVLKNGSLEVGGKFQLTYIKSSDTLTMPGIEYKRKK